MISKVKNTITVRQLYDYALQHNYLDSDAIIVLDIINRESNNINIGIVNKLNSFDNNLVSPVNNASTIGFNTLVEYSIEDLLALFST